MAPTINSTTIARLLEIAGLIIGVGDNRQEKGKGSNGQFELCDQKDVQLIVRNGGLKA